MPAGTMIVSAPARALASITAWRRLHCPAMLFWHELGSAATRSIIVLTVNGVAVRGLGVGAAEVSGFCFGVRCPASKPAERVVCPRPCCSSLMANAPPARAKTSAEHTTARVTENARGFFTFIAGTPFQYHRTRH